MSKNRHVPTVPAKATPQTMRQYGEQVRAYAQSEFAKGKDDVAVWKALKSEGAVLLARGIVRDQYLEYIGISIATRKRLSIVGPMVAMVIYFLLSIAFSAFEPRVRIPIAMLLAIACAFSTMIIVRAQWRRRGRAKH